MNKNKVMAMIRKRSVESGISVNTLLLTYFFERFLARLSESSYKTDDLKRGILSQDALYDLLSEEGE